VLATFPEGKKTAPIRTAAAAMFCTITLSELHSESAADAPRPGQMMLQDSATEDHFCYCALQAFFYLPLTVVVCLVAIPFFFALYFG